MKTKKKFDAAKMMREIRDKHYEKYKDNPQLREKRLQDIRKKYAEKIKEKKRKRIGGMPASSQFFLTLMRSWKLRET